MNEIAPSEEAVPERTTDPAVAKLAVPSCTCEYPSSVTRAPAVTPVTVTEARPVALMAGVFTRTAVVSVQGRALADAVVVVVLVWVGPEVGLVV